MASREEAMPSEPVNAEQLQGLWGWKCSFLAYLPPSALLKQDGSQWLTSLYCHGLGPSRSANKATLERKPRSNQRPPTVTWELMILSPISRFSCHLCLPTSFSHPIKTESRWDFSYSQSGGTCSHQVWWTEGSRGGRCNYWKSDYCLFWSIGYKKRWDGLARWFRC